MLHRQFNQQGKILIDSTKLLNVQHPHEFGTGNDGFASKEAEDLYDEMFSSRIRKTFSCLTKSIQTS